MFNAEHTEIARTSTATLEQAWRLIIVEMDPASTHDVSHSEHIRELLIKPGRGALPLLSPSPCQRSVRAGPTTRLGRLVDRSLKMSSHTSHRCPVAPMSGTLGVSRPHGLIGSFIHRTRSCRTVGSPWKPLYDCPPSFKRLPTTTVSGKSLYDCTEVCFLFPGHGTRWRINLSLS